MRHVLSRLMTLALPALLLAVGLLWWSGAQAGEHSHHPDGAHAAPCHEQADSGPAPAHDPGTSDRQCPDCRCLFAGCATQTALPGLTGGSPEAFFLASPQGMAPARLVTQALTGPPAEPPRL